MCTERYTKGRHVHTHAAPAVQPREPEPATQTIVAGETIAQDAVAPTNDDTAEHAAIPAPAGEPVGAAPGSEA